jgi:acyl dehydratase
MPTINSIDELKARAGEDLGVSEWHEVTQAEIDTFAEATGDHQWIHVDPSARAIRRSAGPSPTATTRSLSLPASWRI